MLHIGRIAGKVATVVTAAATVGACGVFAYNYKDVGKHVRLSEDEVIKYWLEAEATDNNHQYYQSYQDAIKKHGNINLDRKSSDDVTLNEIRRNVFWDVRGKYILWAPIHKKTEWYTRKMLINPWNCDEIVAPYKPSWDDKRNDGENNGKLILWGHGPSDPSDSLMVLEGNHRWEYFYKTRWFPFFCNVVVGYSPHGHHINHERVFNCQTCKSNKQVEEGKRHPQVQQK